MADIKIKHSKIKFEKMDKNSMYVNATVAAATRKKIDSNYQQIVNAWTEVEKSFSSLKGKSDGKVQSMFAEAAAAATVRKNKASDRKRDLDNGLAKDVKEYATKLLNTSALETLIKKLKS